MCPNQLNGIHLENSFFRELSTTKNLESKADEKIRANKRVGKMVSISRKMLSRADRAVCDD